MDPNALLQVIRDLYDPVLEGEVDVESFVERVRDLDEWLSKGGFSPDAWKTVQPVDQWAEEVQAKLSAQVHVAVKDSAADSVLHREVSRTVITDEERDQHLYKIWFDDLHQCGCGQPTYVAVMVLEILKVLLKDPGNGMPKIVASYGRSAAEFILHVLTDAELIEHSSVVDYSWTTPRGKWVLEQAARAGSVDKFMNLMDNIGYPHSGETCPADCEVLKEMATA